MLKEKIVMGGKMLETYQQCPQGVNVICRCLSTQTTHSNLSSDFFSSRPCISIISCSDKKASCLELKKDWIINWKFLKCWKVASTFTLFLHSPKEVSETFRVGSWIIFEWGSGINSRCSSWTTFSRCGSGLGSEVVFLDWTLPRTSTSFSVRSVLLPLFATLWASGDSNVWDFWKKNGVWF